MLPGGPRCTRPLATRVWRLRLSGAARLGREQFPDLLLAEVLADDGGPDKDAAGSRPKALQPRRQQGLNRGRQRRPDVASALLAEGDRQLLQVEGIAASGVDEPGPGGRGNALTRGQRVEQRCGRALAERRELDADRPVRLGRPGRALVEQLRAADADQQYRRAPRLKGERFHQVEEGRFGPVQVLEHDQHRAAPRERFQEAAGRPEDLGGARPAPGAGAESAVQLIGDGRRVRLPGQQGLDPFRRVAAARPGEPPPAAART